MSQNLIKKHTVIIIALLLSMIVSSNIFAKSVDHVEQSHDQITELTAALDQIDDYLDKDIISQERIDLFESRIKKLQSEINTIKKENEQKFIQQKALLSVLGPVPSKGELPEDDIANAKREEISAQVATYQGIIKTADALLFQSKKLQDELVAISLKNKAKGLLARKEPLFDLEVWRYAWSDKALAMQDFANKYRNVAINPMDSISISYYAIFIFYCLFAIYLIYPLAWFLNKRYGERKKDAIPGTFRKVFTGVIQLTAKAIMPLISLWFIFYGLKISQILVFDNNHLLFVTFVGCSILVLSYFIATIILPINKPSWMILPLTLHSANKARDHFIIFMMLVALNWYLTNLFYIGIFNVDFYLAADFLLRLTTCTVGLLLLRQQNWVIDSDKVSNYETTKKYKIAKGIKCILAIVFVTNPMLIFFGYLQLANSIFLSVVEVILLIIIFFSLHYIAKELLGRLFFGKDKIPKIDEATTKVTNKVALHYWTMLVLDITFFTLGTFFILLSLGIERELIFRYIAPLFSGIMIGHYVFSLKILFLSMAIFFALCILTKFIQTALRKNILPHTSIEMAAKQAIVQGVGYVGIIIAIIAGLLALGMNFTSFAIIAGALSVGIGFGLQHIVGNFISGVIMLIERPIKVGDRIVVGQDEGIVKRISVRATEIEDFENSSILIPNSDLISGRLQNWTFHNPTNRLSVSVGVAYGTDVKKVEKLLYEVAEENSNVVSNPAPRVYFDDFGDSALIFRLLVYLYDISKRNRTPSHLRFAIEEKFRQNGIIIPFPQRDIHIKE